MASETGDWRTAYEYIRSKAIRVLSDSLRNSAPGMLDSLCELERAVYAEVDSGAVLLDSEAVAALRVVLRKAHNHPYPTRESDAAYDRLLAAIDAPLLKSDRT